MTNYSRSVLKSNGPHHSKNLPVKFGFSSKSVPANIVQKLSAHSLLKSVFFRISTSLTNAPRSLSQAKVGTHLPLLKESHTRAHTAKHGAFSPLATVRLCAASEISFIPPRFYIHTFPGSLRTLTISNSSISDHLSSRFSTSRTNGLRLLSQVKAGTHSAFGEGSHTTAHTAKQGGVSDGGGIITLDTSCTFTNIPGPGIRTAYFAAFGSWSGGTPEERREPTGQRCAYARRCSEASRPRWAA